MGWSRELMLRSLLIDAEKTEWNDLFHPRDALIWIAEKNEMLTTKSAYHVARSCNDVCRDTPSGSNLSASVNFLWKALWRAQVPGKIKIGIWRCCWNTIPKRVNLVKCKVLSEAPYLFCKEQETVEHAWLQ
ncbi:hypothetical protein DVH24_039204 [Malus domestica]|uniref:Reverse transcriptase zinc-binding domain-containing protein n=1 Tax=Malus domestica TaxID=3750 RepID=A0A498K9F9_MALDO|nr:hypothetical protein DVH24_039204 [Malus domestica]